MANAYDSIIEQRARGSQNRLSITADALENRRREQQAQRKFYMDILADPTLTQESRREFQQTGDAKALERVADKVARDKTVQEAEDKVAYADLLFMAKRGDGSFDENVLRRISPRVPPSLLGYHKQLIEISTPPPVRERNIDPNSPEGIAARTKYYWRTTGSDMDDKDKQKASAKPQPRYDRSTIERLNDVSARIAQTGSRIDAGGYLKEVPGFFGSSQEAIPYTPEQIDSMAREVQSDKILKQGYEDWLAGKNTWQAQQYQEMLDTEADSLRRENALLRLQAGE